MTRAGAPADGGSPVLGYDLQYSTDGAIWAEVLGISPSETISGLVPGTSYQVQTRAVNANGSGPWSASGTGASGSSVPAQMSAPILSATGSISISVALGPVSGDGGSAITSFDLRYSTDQANWTEMLDIADPEDLTGLLASTQYFVETRATNANGDGPWSQAASISTLAPSDPTAPVIDTVSYDPSTRVFALALTEASGNATVHVAGVASPSAPTAAQIVAGSGGGVLERQSIPVTSGNNSPTLTFSTETIDEFHVVAVDGSGNRSAVTVVTGVVVDNTAPSVVVRLPADGATSVSSGSSFQIRFSETMARTGTHALHRVGGAVVETFDLATGNGSAGGTASWSTTTLSDDTVTLAPGAPLSPGTDYAFRRSGLQDRFGNALPDVTDDATYNFTTSVAVQRSVTHLGLQNSGAGFSAAPNFSYALPGNGTYLAVFANRLESRAFNGATFAGNAMTERLATYKQGNAGIAAYEFVWTGGAGSVTVVPTMSVGNDHIKCSLYRVQGAAYIGLSPGELGGGQNPTFADISVNTSPGDIAIGAALGERTTTLAWTDATGTFDQVDASNNVGDSVFATASRANCAGGAPQTFRLDLADAFLNHVGKTFIYR